MGSFILLRVETFEDCSTAAAPGCQSPETLPYTSPRQLWMQCLDVCEQMWSQHLLLFWERAAAPALHVDPRLWCLQRPHHRRWWNICTVQKRWSCWSRPGFVISKLILRSSSGFNCSSPSSVTGSLVYFSHLLGVHFLRLEKREIWRTVTSRWISWQFSHRYVSIIPVRQSALLRLRGIHGWFRNNNKCQCAKVTSQC